MLPTPNITCYCARGMQQRGSVLHTSLWCGENTFFLEETPGTVLPEVVFFLKSPLHPCSPRGQNVLLKAIHSPQGKSTEDITGNIMTEGGGRTHLLLTLAIWPLTTQSRRSTVPTSNRETSNVWALIMFSIYITQKKFAYVITFLLHRRLWPPSISEDSDRFLAKI